MLIAILVGGFVVLVFGIIGAVLIYKYFQEKKEAEESQGWSSTIGQIIKSFMRREVSYESNNTIYYPEVEYLYEFIGTEYTGHRIAFGGSAGHSNSRKSEEVLARYPVGKSVPVFYDSNNPQDSVLIRKMGTGGKVFLFVGALFLLLSICTVCVGGIIALSQVSL
ncbi:MAG: DUF3592 domain-containing protein [Anaerolineae bacterium]|jgi:hypothetical protein|nr:DUF3592 domain-containing protein [Anaerolineae bacterium]MBT7190844.1 DUF3592 domain-containing protein [Anaerolineae bacterium]MBT7991585.1 DUF3592 domain-containing protein [Anaerolineae bacterium]